MKAIEVRDQVSLPLRRCVQLTVHGIRYRLFRSAVTVVIVSLAVAFLMMMLSNSYIDRQVAEDVQERTADRRLLETWVDKLSVPMTLESLDELLAEVRPDQPAREELLAWGGEAVGTQPLHHLTELAETQRRYDRFLSKISPSERSALVAARTGEEVYAHLEADPAALDDFLDKATKLGTGFPATKEEFRRFVPEFVRTAPLRRAIVAGHTAAVEGVNRQRGSVTVLGLLADPEKHDAEAVLRANHFLPPERVFDRLSFQANLALDAQKLVGLLRYRRMRALVAERTGTEVAQVAPKHIYQVGRRIEGARWIKDEVQATQQEAKAQIDELEEALASVGALDGRSDQEIAAMAAAAKARPDGPEAARLGTLLLADVIRRELAVRMKTKEILVKPPDLFESVSTVEGANWLKPLLGPSREEFRGRARESQGQIIESTGLSPERIVEVCGRTVEQDRLLQVLSRVQVEEGTGWMGFSGRVGWLIIISFVVCVVGVANAMLMSVTERFREIATMKCLGALDSFIMIIFVVESSLQGLAGGLMGVVLGFLLGVVRSLWSFGLLAMTNLPGLTLLVAAGACIVVGIVLAALAALYPAAVAARLAPMEAMRIE